MSNKHFEKRVVTIFKELKYRSSKNRFTLAIENNEKSLGQLAVIVENDNENPQIVRKLAYWRRKYSNSFPSQFKVTNAGTKKWMTEQLLNKEDRILFMVKNNKNTFLGHMGLYSFDFDEESCEIDNVVRGVNITPGIMTYALKSLINWTETVLQPKKIKLRVFLDNEKAINLYKRCNFAGGQKIPLIKRITESATFWETLESGIKRKPERYFLVMEYNK